MLSLYETRPPLVSFKQISVHDQVASEAAGRAVYRDVNLVNVTQPPGRDVLEKNAEKWLAQIKENVMRGNPNAYPREWVDAIYRAYEDWKNGIECKVPEGETALRNIPFVTPAEVENYAEMGIHTIEAAASMTEEALMAAGIGGRAFRDKCRSYLDQAENTGKAVEEIAALKKQLEIRDGMIAALEKRLSALESGEAEKPKRGRPRKLEEAA